MNKRTELRNDYGYQGERMPIVTRNEETNEDLKKRQEAEAARIKRLQEERPT